MKAVFNAINQVKNLPDIYDKTVPNKEKGIEGSNNYKILEIERLTLQDIRESLREIDSILDINNAKGKTLDLYGERVGQPRGKATDSQYLIMIKAKILRNLTNATIPSIITALCATLQSEPSQISITDGDEPYTVNIEKLPLRTINNAGLTISQVTAIIKSMLPVGVSLKSFMIEGTFELSSSYEDMKIDGATKGLTDSYENMKNSDAIGGYLGATVGDENETILPI